MDGILHAYKLCIRRYAIIIGIMLAVAVVLLAVPELDMSVIPVLIFLSWAPFAYIGAEKRLQNLRIYSRVMPYTSRTFTASKYLTYLALQGTALVTAVGAVVLRAAGTGDWNINVTGFAAGLGLWLSYIATHICMQSYITREKFQQADAEDGVNIMIAIVPLLQMYIVTGPRNWNAFLRGALSRGDDFSLSLNISDTRWLIFLGISVALFIIAFPVSVMVHRERE